MGTIKLNAVKSAYARRDNPNTHYSTSASGMYYLRGLGPNDFLLFKFASVPNNLRHNKIYGGDVGIQLRVGESTAKIQVNLNDFNPDTVTYASAPDLNSYYDIVFQDSSHLGQWRDFASSSNALYPSTTRRAILYGMTVSGDLLYDIYIRRFPAFSSFEIHYVDPLGTGSKEFHSLGFRIVAVYSHLAVIALVEPDGFAFYQIYCR